MARGCDVESGWLVRSLECGGGIDGRSFDASSWRRRVRASRAHGSHPAAQREEAIAWCVERCAHMAGDPGRTLEEAVSSISVPGEVVLTDRAAGSRGSSVGPYRDG